MQRAMEYAVRALRGQTRDDGFTPAVTHAFETLTNLTEVARVRDEELACAALLHDVIEDGDASWDNALEAGFSWDNALENGFSSRVVRIVRELTLPPDLNVHGKTAHLVKLMQEGSLDAVLVKLCDRLSNVSNMRSWKPSRRARYVQQTKAMLCVLFYRHIETENGSDEVVKGIKAVEETLGLTIAALEEKEP